LKNMTELFEEQEARAQKGESDNLKKSIQDLNDHFVANQEGVSTIVKRTSASSSAVGDSADPLVKRKKLIDDTDRSVKLQELSRVSPWVPQFTPAAGPAPLERPPQRPASPFSGRPLRARDLMPLQLLREQPAGDSHSSIVRFICPVSRKTITNQKVLMLRNTGTVMLESAAKDLALPSMTCPLTGRPFKSSDLLELVPAASGFAASGTVEAKIHRPSFN